MCGDHVASLDVSTLQAASSDARMSGFGKVIDSNAIGASESHNVLPVYVFFRPMTATISRPGLFRVPYRSCLRMGGRCGSVLP